MGYLDILGYIAATAVVSVLVALSFVCVYCVYRMVKEN